MPELTYKSGVLGDVFDLEADIMLNAALGLRTRDWDYKLSARSLYSQNRKAREAKVTLHIAEMSRSLDEFMWQTDADVKTGRPGTLTALTEAGDEWTQRAYFPASEPQSHHRSSDANIDLTCILLDGVWRREVRTLIEPVGQGGGDWLDLPTDTPFDLMGMQQVAKLENPDYAPDPLRIRFYGPCVNPYVIIAGNTYRLNMSIPSGARVEVDGVNEPKSIIMVDENGNQTNVFDKGERGNGLNGGNYIFQPVPAGQWDVNWPGTFTVELFVCVERSEPPWIS